GEEKDIRRAFSALPLLNLPAAQIILLDHKRDFAIRCDAALKLVALVPSQIRENEPPTDGLFSDLLPPAAPLRQAQAKLEQRLAAMRNIEALRIHAAENNGQL